jgi:hypothetical protein
MSTILFSELYKQAYFQQVIMEKMRYTDINPEMQVENDEFLKKYLSELKCFQTNFFENYLNERGIHILNYKKTPKEFILESQSQVNLTNENEQAKKKLFEIQVQKVEKKATRFHIPFLDKFNLIKGKRENIDKTIIRNFKKFLKKNQHYYLEKFELWQSWRSFVKLNLLPPFVYETQKEKIEFKSFNTNYLIWLFSLPQAKFLYEIYVENCFDRIFDKISSNNDSGDENSRLKYYIKNLSEIYSSYVYLKD